MLLILAALMLFSMFATDFGEDLSLVGIQDGAIALKTRVEAHYLPAVVAFVLAYIVVNLWFPAAAMMTLLSGFLFGTVLGAVYVDAAATIGAVVAFEVTRNVAGNRIQRKWGKQLEGFNRALSEYGHEYLLMVRMIPVMPYFLINFLGGLTKVRLVTFAWTTALGSLPGILIFCYAGRQLLAIESVDQVLSFDVVIAFVLMAVFVGSALFVRWRLRRTRN
jgi:uncharacterized membrane protein YdjX (TVP38/TMEM64 family)